MSKNSMNRFSVPQEEEQSLHGQRKSLRRSFCVFLMILTSLWCWQIQPLWAMSLMNSLLANPAVIISQNQGDRIPDKVVEAVRQDLSRRTKLAASQFKLVKASQQTWQDGCLGLAKPDEICTQALLEGWRVVLSYRSQSWIYRTDSQGRIVRREK